MEQALASTFGNLLPCEDYGATNQICEKLLLFICSIHLLARAGWMGKLYWDVWLQHIIRLVLAAAQALIPTAVWEQQPRSHHKGAYNVLYIL